MSPASTARVQAAKAAHDVVKNVAFEWGLANSEGAWFRLLREPHHTDVHIAKAKDALRANRDVVTMTVERLS